MSKPNVPTFSPLWPISNSVTMPPIARIAADADEPPDFTWASTVTEVSE